MKILKLITLLLLIVSFALMIAYAINPIAVLQTLYKIFLLAGVVGTLAVTVLKSKRK